jgi:hypothetical protein
MAQGRLRCSGGMRRLAKMAMVGNGDQIFELA